MFFLFHRKGIDADLWQIMGSCMMKGLNSVCLEFASPNLWNTQEQQLWLNYIRTTFALGAQRCLKPKVNDFVSPPIAGVLSKRVLSITFGVFDIFSRVCCVHFFQIYKCYLLNKLYIY